MPYSEYVGWQKYLSIEPWNSIEIQSALIATVQSNSMGGKSKIEDMLITQKKHSSKPDDKPMSGTEVLSVFKGLGILNDA